MTQEKRAMDIRDIKRTMNFRELGGLPLSDGRTVKRGLFYRCGALADLDEEELAYVRSLGIRHVFDFRSSFEAEMASDPDIGAEYHNINALVFESGQQVNFSPEGMESIVRKAASGDGMLQNMYGNLPFCNAYKVMFRALVKEETPILFHCSAGKDRTGIAAVLILLLLGADEETALDDYMLTNAYRQELIDLFMERFASVIGGDEDRRRQLVAFEGVNRSSAEYSLDVIKQKYGTYEAYFLAEHGIDETIRHHLVDIYSE